MRGKQNTFQKRPTFRIMGANFPQPQSAILPAPGKKKKTKPARRGNGIFARKKKTTRPAKNTGLAGRGDARSGSLAGRGPAAL